MRTLQRAQRWYSTVILLSPLPGTVLMASRRTKRRRRATSANTASLHYHVRRSTGVLVAVVGALFVLVDGGDGCSGESNCKPHQESGTPISLREIGPEDGADLRRAGMADVYGQLEPSMRGAAGM